MTERRPGIYAGISNAAYHGGPGISKSGLDLIARSPFHFRAAMDARAGAEKTATPAQRLGSIVHKLILEPAEFAEEYALPFEAPDGALGSSDEIKERLRDLGLKVSGVKAELIERLRDADPSAVFRDDLFAEYLAENEGKTIVGREEYDLGMTIRNAVYSHKFARALLTSAPGASELSAYWIDDETGVTCRCRPDLWRFDGVIVDVKTTSDASPEAFARSVLDYRYHVQAAMYLEGTTAAAQAAEIDAAGDVTDVPTSVDFVFIAVETKPPHAVACYRLDAETLDVGQRELRRNLATYAECLRTGDWPAFGDGLQPLALPEWFLAREARAAALQAVAA